MEEGHFTPAGGDICPVSQGGETAIRTEECIIRTKSLFRGMHYENKELVQMN